MAKLEPEAAAQEPQVPEAEAELPDAASAELPGALPEPVVPQPELPVSEVRWAWPGVVAQLWSAELLPALSLVLLV